MNITNISSVNKEDTYWIIDANSIAIIPVRYLGKSHFSDMVHYFESGTPVGSINVITTSFSNEDEIVNQGNQSLLFASKENAKQYLIESFGLTNDSFLTKYL